MSAPLELCDDFVTMSAPLELSGNFAGMSWTGSLAASPDFRLSCLKVSCKSLVQISALCRGLVPSQLPGS